MANNLYVFIWNSMSILKLMRNREQAANSQTELLVVHLHYLFELLQLALSRTMPEQTSEILLWAPHQKNRIVLHNLATFTLNSLLPPRAFYPQESLLSLMQLLEFETVLCYINTPLVGWSSTTKLFQTYSAENAQKLITIWSPQSWWRIWRGRHMRTS